MKSGKDVAIVLVTAPELKTARKLVRLALTQKLVACANLLPRVESHYWWQGKIEKSAEVLIVFKAPRKTVEGLKAIIVKAHPYDTPEFVVLPVGQVSKRYLKWWLSPGR